MKKQFKENLKKALAIVIGSACGISAMLLISSITKKGDDASAEQLVFVDSENDTAVIVEVKDDEVVSTTTVPASAVTEAATEATTEAHSTSTTATTQAPATTEVPATTQAPATTEAPATTQAPAATEAPAAPVTTECSHNWVEITETVNVPEKGHMVSTTYWLGDDGTKYPDGTRIYIYNGREAVITGKIGYTVCNTGGCGQKFSSMAAYKAHLVANPDPRWDDVCPVTGYISSTTTVYEDIYVNVTKKTENIWVIDSPATTETRTVGYECSKCGAKK